MLFHALHCEFFPIISQQQPPGFYPALEHYVIFFCDDCDRLEPAITAFKKVQSGVVVHTSSTLEDLFSRISKKRPELLLLYFHDSGNSYVEILKAIRENKAATSIPLLVYHSLPEAAELENAFRNFRKNDA